jgi:hypothetical protein
LEQLVLLVLQLLEAFNCFLGAAGVEVEAVVALAAGVELAAFPASV